MKKKMIYITIILSVFISTTSLKAQAGLGAEDVVRTGLSGWQFLKINGDAGQAGMAGAFTAAYTGSSQAIFGNPSGLAEVQNIDVAFNNVTWIADIQYTSVAVGYKMGSGVVGLSFASLSYGDMDETINSQVAGETRTEAVVTGNTFTAADNAVGVSYAKKVTDQLSVGGNYRIISETIEDYSVSNYSLDFGTTYYTGYKSLRLSMVARNFGPDVRLAGWDEDVQVEPVDIKMPVDYRVGLAMDFLDDGEGPHFMTVSCEGTHPNDGREKINLGVQYLFKDMLAIRAGYRANYDEEGLTFGFGVNVPLGGRTARVDYGYVDFGRLQSVSMISIGLSL